jgi:lipoyl(octanoyl) transferase
MTQVQTLVPDADLAQLPNNLVNYLVKKLGYNQITRTPILED